MLKKSLFQRYKEENKNDVSYETRDKESLSLQDVHDISDSEEEELQDMQKATCPQHGSATEGNKNLGK
ncbi:hypothetical protein TNIN_183861 [Trichonephila inaurata madagascariensis]|uniref:Uncharacterized protein n=1 Tax=Trichonephila inaurata madagascariensis TaxID=2747483 RepID=A0A8X6MAQ9_9ARAC|nr:hypothetical protein TNIN_183861 [Trichonephila inaurata madagascariensis]